MQSVTARIDSAPPFLLDRIEHYLTNLTELKLFVDAQFVY